MRNRIVAAVRGVAAAVAVGGVGAAVVLVRAGAVGLTVIVGVGALGAAGVAVAAGGSGVGRALAFDGEGGDEWYPARVSAAVGDAWNAWSTVALAVGVGAVAVGSFARIVVVAANGDVPSAAVLIAGFFGLNLFVLIVALSVE